MANILTVKNIIIYLSIINLITFLAMYIDKKRAERGEWRIKESTLFLLTIIGGSIGGIAGMYVFHHKTNKLKYNNDFRIPFLIFIFQFLFSILISDFQFHIVIIYDAI